MIEFFKDELRLVFFKEKAKDCSFKKSANMRENMIKNRPNERNVNLTLKIYELFMNRLTLYS